jgi:hypothetical protein
MITTKLFRSGATLLLCSPLFAGCLLTMAGDDDVDSNSSASASASDTDSPSDTGVSSLGGTDDADGSSGIGESSSDDDSGGETTDGPTGDCSATRIVDGGFEAGTPSAAWTEASEHFGTPICDTGCTEEEGAVPYAGDWYAWFGGVAEAEHASVTQSVTLDGASAYLDFRFEINASAGTGDDVFTVTIDGQTVFMATDLEIDDYAGYTPISIDVSEFIGDGDHVVEFKSDHLGTGMSSFFLDEVALVTCDEGGESSSSGDAETTAADSGTGDDSSDSGSDSSSSDGSSSDGSSDDSGSSSTGM